MTIVSFGVSPERVQPGGAVVARWTVRNDTGERRHFRINLFLNGASIHSKYLGFVGNGESRTGYHTFYAPNAVGSYTVEAVTEYEVEGRYLSSWQEDDRKSVTLVVYNTDNGGDNVAGCSKETFRNGMFNAYKETAIFLIDSYTPVLDVTPRVQKVSPLALKAFLIIEGGDTGKIEVVGPYDKRPEKYPDGRPLTDENVVENWKYGEEWERQRCPADGKYYWVKYPCLLITLPPDPTLMMASTVGRFVRKLQTKTRARRG